MLPKATALFSIALCCCAALCQNPAPLPAGATAGPVEAELLKPLNVRSLTLGATVFARVTRDWKSPDCNLRQGATLEAKVEQADLHKGRTESKLALAFIRAQCDGADMKPMELLLSAVAQVSGEVEAAPSGRTSVPTPFVNPTSLGTRGGGGGAPSGRPTSDPVLTNGYYSWHIELKDVDHHFPMSARVQPGDVIDIKGLKLDLGTGPNRSSVLSTRSSDVRLDQYTQFLLVPSSLVFTRSEVPVRLPAGADAMMDLAQGLADPPPANDFEVCAPPGCAVDLPVSSEELQGPTAASIEISPLGYAARPNLTLSNFNEEEAVAWLGPNQLLFTFNAHRLITRGGVANWKAAQRIIRAVLLDPKDRSILRAVDWEVMDLKRYLWPLSGDRVLAHIGNELRVYRAGFEVEQTIPLAGPLDFVQMSPNGEVIAVATLRERHSAELHASLRDDLGTEPEEDVDVAILDRKFNTIAKASTVSGILPPTLLNEGQVTLLAQPNHRFRLALSSWEGKSSTLARFESLCKPELSSLAPDLLFLVTCSTATDQFEYRVLRHDGKMLMHGEASRFVSSEEATGAASNGLFAMKAVHSGEDFSPGMDFKGADLAFEELRVYRAADGKRLLAVHVNDPNTSRGGYALSPDGSRLAVLSASQIQLFTLPAAR